MADVATYKSALIKAHKAGDTQAAQMFASKIKEMQTMESENVNVDSGSMGGTGDIQPVTPAAGYQYGTTKEKQTLMPVQSEAAETMGMPELTDSGLLAGEGAAGVAAITPALLTSTDPNEIVQIISSNYPNIATQYQKAPDGNVYPFMTNRDTGAQAVINKPGFSTMDVLQTLGIVAAYAPAGRAATVTGAAIKSGLTGAAMEGAQAASGGEFNPSGPILDTMLGGGGKVIENVLSGGVRAARGTIPEAEAAIIKAGDEAGVPVLTTDVVKPDTLAGKISRSTGETIPIAGTGGLRASQQKGREQVAESFAENVAPKYAEVVQSLRNKTSKVMKAAGDRLNVIGTKMDEVGQITTESSIKAIDDEISALSAPGRVPDTATIDTLTQYKTALEEGQVFTSLDTLRSDFREAVKGDRVSLPTRSNAAMTRIYNAMTTDLKKSIDGILGTEQVGKWTQAKGFYGKELDMLKKSRLKAILDKGDVTPENVKNIIFSQKPSEMKALYSSLTGNGRAATRASIINEVVERASKKVGGLTPNSLATELNKANPQINVFFKGEERKQLIGLKNFIDATRRAQDAAVATPTGQSLALLVTGGGMVANPTVTIPLLATVGGLARVYESAPVRNAMLRLSSIKKGTKAYDKAIIETTQALTTAAQALADQEQQ